MCIVRMTSLRIFGESIPRNQADWGPVMVLDMARLGNSGETCLMNSVISKQRPCLYRGTSLTRKRTPLRPYRRPMPRVQGGSKGAGRFLLGEVPL